MLDDDGMLGADGIQICPCRVAHFLDHGVVIPPTDDPSPFGGPPCTLAKQPEHIFNGFHRPKRLAVDIDPWSPGRVVDEMAVRVDEAG